MRKSIFTSFAYYRALKSCRQSKEKEESERGSGGSNCMYKRTSTSGGGGGDRLATKNVGRRERCIAPVGK